MLAKSRSITMLLALCAWLLWTPLAFGALNVNVLDLDGSGDYVRAVDAANLTNFTNGAFTIQAWVYVQQLGTNQPIVSKYQSVSDQRSWALSVTNVGQLRAYVSGDGTSGGTYTWQTPGTVVTSDVWYHVAFVCDPTGLDKIKFYVNNVDKPHSNVAQDPPSAVFNSDAEMYVGRFLNQYFYGYIDELRITNGVLTSFPSNTLDVPLIPEQSPATQVLYHFDESSGNVHDYSNLWGNPTNTGYLMGNATRRAWDGLGPNNDLPLPITLIALTAVGGNENVNINWTTETEIDNLGYHLYRSTNQNSGFDRITSQMIPSQGFSLTTHNYSYVDERDLVNGLTYFYKISDVDVNGYEHQHETIASATPSTQPLLPGESSALAPYQLWQNYPNPFNGTTSIRYYVRESGVVHLGVFNLVGEQVSLLVNEVQSAGEHVCQFDATPYPASIYFIRLTGDNGYDNIKKMLFLK